MQITKCDICKKKIKNEAIMVGIGFFGRKELCEKCGSPILRFLKKYKLIEKENRK